MIDYLIKINNGNENIGSDIKSITVKEKVKTAGVKDLSREIHLLNTLIPEQVAAAVLDNFCEAAAALMAMGQAVVLKSKGKAAIRLIPDVKLNGRNITLTRAQQLDNTIFIPQKPKKQQKKVQKMHLKTIPTQKKLHFQNTIKQRFNSNTTKKIKKKFVGSK